MILLMMIFLICLIFILLMILNLLISKKEYLYRDKISSFECGFIPLSSSRLPFSINFYMIAILFLIFDVEIVFLLPIINLMNFLNFLEFLFSSFLILFILLVGLEYEKKEGSLKWMF